MHMYQEQVRTQRMRRHRMCCPKNTNALKAFLGAWQVASALNGKPCARTHLWVLFNSPTSPLDQLLCTRGVLGRFLGLLALSTTHGKSSLILGLQNYMLLVGDFGPHLGIPWATFRDSYGTFLGFLL